MVAIMRAAFKVTILTMCLLYHFDIGQYWWYKSLFEILHYQLLFAVGVLKS